MVYIFIYFDVKFLMYGEYRLCENGVSFIRILFGYELSS